MDWTMIRFMTNSILITLVHMGRCLAPNMSPIRLMNKKRHEELNQKRTRHLAGLTKILLIQFLHNN